MSNSTEPFAGSDAEPKPAKGGRGPQELYSERSLSKKSGSTPMPMRVAVHSPY